MRWQKEKDPLAPGRAAGTRGLGGLFLLALAVGALSFLSFRLFDSEAGTGDVSRRVSYFEEFFEENDAVAVFLGWEGSEE